MTLRPQKHISKAGLDFIRKQEGERLTAYYDNAGILTVGVGHRVLPDDNILDGMIISQARSDQFLKHDISTAEKNVNLYVTVPLNQSQYDALISFTFNTGGENFKKSTLLKMLNDYNYSGALKEFSRWVYSTNPITHKKTVNTILVSRRALEQNLFVS